MLDDGVDVNEVSRSGRRVEPDNLNVLGHLLADCTQFLADQCRRRVDDDGVVVKQVRLFRVAEFVLADFDGELCRPR